MKWPVGTTAGPSTGPFTIDLTTAGAQCGAYPYGVYPVRIELVDTASGQALGGLTTHLIYANPRPVPERLQRRSGPARPHHPPAATAPTRASYERAPRRLSPHPRRPPSTR